jgi:hypothetical protein
MRRGAVLIVPLVAGALLLVWWAPWSSAPHVITGARQAFGTGRVVHVLASLGIDPHGPAMRPITSDESIEVWYDPARRRTHVVLRRGTKVALDKVEAGFQPPDVPPLANVPAPLWEFVTGYRSILARGQYHIDSSDRIQGRRVFWLSARELDEAADVAVDPVSYQPLWLRAPGEMPRILVAVAVTKPYDPADFLTAKEKKARHL